MDNWGWSRKKAALINFFIVAVTSLPCVFGFNLWSAFMPFGDGSNVLDLEDFVVSNLLLPFGSLIYLLFCTHRFGWGFSKYQAEANEGEGARVPGWIRIWVSWILPVLVVFLLLYGVWAKFFGA